MNTPNHSLTLTIYERLRADVLSGRLLPGQKLLMQELTRRYNVGATPLREALNRLTSEHWVVHQDQRGFVVAQATRDQLHDLVETRIALEGLALAQAFARRTETWEEALVLAFHRLARAPRSSDDSEFVENPNWERLHRDFHRALLSGCESPTLLAFCEQLYDRSYRYRQLAARVAHHHRNERDEHRAMLEALLGGRLEEAQQLLASHYRTTAKFYLSEPATQGGTPESPSPLAAAHEHTT